MPSTSYHLLAAHQESYKNACPLDKRWLIFWGERNNRPLAEKRQDRHSKRTRLELLLNVGVRDPAMITLDSLSSEDGTYLIMVTLEKCPALVTLDFVSSEDEMSCACPTRTLDSLLWLCRISIPVRRNTLQ